VKGGKGRLGGLGIWKEEEEDMRRKALSSGRDCVWRELHVKREEQPQALREGATWIITKAMSS
jgi:hypothetical protein